MATSPRLAFKKALDQTEQLDAQGLSPFVGLHLGGEDVIHLRRTSSMGFVVTEGAPELADPGWVFVSYSHLQESLKYLDGDKIEALSMPTGATVLRSVDAQYETVLRVHTVSRRQSGFKTHNPLGPWLPLDTAWMKGFNTRPFILTLPPVVVGTQLVLQTIGGAVTWEMTYDPEVPSFPREAFLKAISTVTPESMELTEGGFYHALTAGVHSYTVAHTSQNALLGDLLGDYDGAGLPLPAGRFIQAVEAGISLAAAGTPLTIGAHRGVTVKNTFGAIDRYSLGPLPAFQDFRISTKTAKVITDALKQAEGEEIHLWRILGHADVLRLTRGKCTVSFRVSSGV